MSATGRHGMAAALRLPLRRLWAAKGSTQGSGRQHKSALIGVDLADRPNERRTRRVVPLAVTAIAVALCLAALRIDLLRIRYALADSIEREQTLLDEKKSLTARKRTLRDPVVLARQAESLGFDRPDQLIDLPGRTDEARDAEEAAALARVSAGPPAETVRR